MKKRKGLFAIGGIALLAGIGAIMAMNSGIQVESAAADRGEVAKILKETGTVESTYTVAITAKLSGEVKAILVEEGDSVKAGDLLMTIDGASAALDIKSLQAEKSGLQTQYNHARELAGKNKALYEQGALSYEAYNTSNTAAKQLAAQISALNYTIESYEESSGKTGITATVDGVITSVSLKQGETAAVGDELFEISNMEDRYVKSDFIAEDADLIQVGDSVKIYNEDAGFLDEAGIVKKIHLKAEDKMSELGVNQKRVTVEIAFGTANSARLGSDLDVEITVEKKDNVLRVPDLAVFEMANEDCVYVIENGTAVRKEITLGLEGEDYTEVRSGLSEGDVLILSPNDDVSDGVKVKTKK